MFATVIPCRRRWPQPLRVKCACRCGKPVWRRLPDAGSNRPFKGDALGMILRLLLATGLLLLPGSAWARRDRRCRTDDGLTSNVKALYEALKADGHDVIVSVPCTNQSGDGRGDQVPEAARRARSRLPQWRELAPAEVILATGPDDPRGARAGLFLCRWHAGDVAALRHRRGGRGAMARAARSGVVRAE